MYMFLCCRHVYIYFMCGMCACMYVLRIGVVHVCMFIVKGMSVCFL